MNWDYSALTDIGWIIGIAVAIIGILYARKTKPKPIRKIVISSKQSDPSLGILLLGGILGYLIGISKDDEDDIK
jgi:hypothetical protein